jgi:hypothetical protein
VAALGEAVEIVVDRHVELGAGELLVVTVGEVFKEAVEGAFAVGVGAATTASAADPPRG